MSKPLTIVAIFQANPGCEIKLEHALRDMIAPTRTEAGCLNYDLHIDLETKGRFLFHENWETRASWETHMASAHLLHFRSVASSLVVSTEILQLQLVD